MAQILQLGIIDAEVTLPEDSRSFVNSGNSLNSIEGRSADGTLHVDFIVNKKGFTINYTVISEANKDIITNIYLSQISTPSFLNFIYTDESDIEVATVVKMLEPSFGSIIPKDEFFYNGVTIELEGV